MSDGTAEEVAYRWHPIEDLPDNWESLARDDLEALAGVWQEQHHKLRESAALEKFNTRLQREWAIETGIIEGLYSLDRGITELLIERGIEASLIPHGATDQPVSHVVDLIRDQQNVVEGLFDFVGGTRDLSISYIREVHQALTRHQKFVDGVNGMGKRVQVPLSHGEWKKMPNNPSRPNGTIHEYCPPEHVASEMDRLIDMHYRHEDANVPPEVEAAWLHHRFTQIHPFQDGNGRVARALATLVFLRAGWFPLVVVSDKHRGNYISALEHADHGDLNPLVDLFARLEKNAFTRALSIGGSVIAEKESFRSLISSVQDRFRLRQEKLEKKRKEVLETAENLVSRTADRMRKLQTELEQALYSLAPGIGVSVTRSKQDSRHWFWNQVVEVARELDYYADLRTYHGWARLRIMEDRQVEIVVSLHPVGTEFVGIAGASAFIEYHIKSADNETKIDGPYLLTDELFEFSYKEDEKRILARFDEWLNEALVKGLGEWRRQL